MTKSMNLLTSWWFTARERRKSAACKLTGGAERAFIYVRSSQAPLDLGEQLRMCRAHADRHGMTVLAEVIDAPASGRSDERPGFAALLAAVANGGIDVVLVQDLSRISRSAATLNYFMKLAVKAGVRVIETGAGVVRHIHEDYFAGQSLGQIARTRRCEDVQAIRCRRAAR